MQCRPFVLDVMQKAAAITVSTEALKAELLQWNPNIYVLPNLIDERLWTQTAATSRRTGRYRLHGNQHAW